MTEQQLAAAWARIVLRDATAGLDKRQARRVRRRLARSLVRRA